MYILLSNDDGIFAPGLAALHAGLKGLAEITVIAPQSGQSAAGRSITLQEPLVVQHVPLNGTEEFAGISVDGRPADCVRLAIRNLLARQPDLVCTGINAGANVGINVFYSGTVAGAAEAAMFGIPAVAFSADTSGGVIDYPRASRLCRWILQRLLDAGLSSGDLINVNLPALQPGRRPQVRIAPQATVEMQDTYHHRLDEQGRETYRLGDDFGFASKSEGCDVDLLEAGYITITPLQVDMTDHGKLSRLGNIQWDQPPDEQGLRN